MIPTLEEAAKHDVAVSLLLSPHYFPKWATDEWPNSAIRIRGFIQHNVNAPQAKAIIKAYLETVVPMVKDYPFCESIILSNEPTYDTRTTHSR